MSQAGITRVVVDKMAAGGDGIARLPDGRVVFVSGGLPGETVDVRLTITKRDYAKAAVTEVIHASPSRVEPPCPWLAAGCGGCSWQHIEAAAQLTLKTAIVHDALRRTAKLAHPVVRTGQAVTPWAYRTTMRCVANLAGVGLRREASHEPVLLDACPVAHDALSKMLPRIKIHGGEDDVTLRVSAATGQATVMLHSPDRTRLHWCPGGAGVGAQATVTEHVAGHELRVSAASFFQSGPQAAELLVDAVSRAAGSLAAGPAVDAYGGVGLFAACVTTGPVTLVESSSSACADARVNLSDHRQATVVCSAVEDWTPLPVPLVIADPARAGLGRSGVAAMAAAATERLILVSCDPVAMARDTALLAEAGFTHQVSEVLDLFPHTPHVEVVTTFDRA